MSRREFVRGLGAGVAAWSLTRTVPFARAAAFGRDPEPRALVIVQLAGGLDARDVIVPTDSDDYHRARPTLALRAADTLRLDHGLALNRACAAFEPLWAEGTLAILPRVGGVATPSHHRASERWHTGDVDVARTSGWLGRAATLLEAQGTPVSCFHGTRFLPRMLRRDAHPRAPGQALKHAGADWPAALAEIGERAGASRTTELYFVTVPGFDTHHAQAAMRGRLLPQACAALGQLQRRLEQRGVAPRVLTLAFSEFGRALPENHQAGTEHEDANAVYLFGRDARRWARDAGSEPEAPIGWPRTIDFRAVCAAVLKDWLHVPPTAILPLS